MYQIEQGSAPVIEHGPPAVSFDAYAASTMDAWRALLASDPVERDVQRFLEHHPALVPGSLGPGGATSPSPLINLLISQPRLTGLDGHQPDFLWFTSTSVKWYAVLIEIERPSKQIFTKKGIPTAEFTQARNQLSQWCTWFSEPANLLKFQLEYGVPYNWLHKRTPSLHMILIYGRRSEFEEAPWLSKHRASLLTAPHEELMSFDRLTPDPFLSDAITVRAVRNGRFKAIAVPPTYTVYPGRAERLLSIDNLEKAIETSDGWSPERRSFVRRRLPYWREWAKLRDKGWITEGESE